MLVWVSLFEAWARNSRLAKDALSRYCAEQSFEGYRARLCAANEAAIDYKRSNSFDLRPMAG